MRFSPLRCSLFSDFSFHFFTFRSALNRIYFFQLFFPFFRLEFFFSPFSLITSYNLCIFLFFFSFLFRSNVCFSCAAATNQFWPHYSVHTGAQTNNKMNKYERNNDNNNEYHDVGGGGNGIERRDQFKSGRPLSHSLGAPSWSSSTMTTDAINLSDSVPNLCAADDNNVANRYCNGHNLGTTNLRINANKSCDAFGAGRVASQVYMDSMNRGSAGGGDNSRSKLLWAKPPISDKSSRIFFGVSLDEREMPITRERQTKLLPAASKRDPSGRKANKSNNGTGLTQSVRNGNTKYDLFMDRPRNR